MFTPSASINKPNFKIVKTVTGYAETEHVLFFGGLNSQGLTNEAKANLYQNAKLKDNQTIANVAVDSKTTFLFFYLYWKEQVYVSADVVEFFSDDYKILNTPISEVPVSNELKKSDVSKSGLVDTSVTNISENSILNLISSKQFYESKYINSFDIKINDIVRYTTNFSEIIYGQVIDKTNPKKIKLKYFSSSHDELNMETSWKELHKITPIEEDALMSVEEKSLIKFLVDNKFTTKKYSSADEVNKNDYIKFMTDFGESIFGKVIDASNPKKVKVKYYSPSHTPLIWEISWNELTKLTPP